MTDTIPVPRAWLERLVYLSEMAKDDEREHLHLTKRGYPTFVSSLIGYASSAETLLTNGEKEEK